MTPASLARTLLARARRDFPQKGDVWRAVAVCAALGDMGVEAKLFLKGIYVEAEKDGSEVFLTVTAIKFADDSLIDEYRRKGEVNILHGHLERNGLADRDWRIDDVSASDLFWGQVSKNNLEFNDAKDQGRRMASQRKADKLMRELGTAVTRTASKPRL